MEINSNPRIPRKELVLRESIPSSDSSFLPEMFPVPMNIEGIVALEKRIGLEDLRELLGARLQPFDRFFQRPIVASDENKKADWHWADDPNFDISRHVRTMHIPQDQWEEQLKFFAELIADQPLPENSPLWDTWLFQIGENKSALLFRINHAISDGIGLISVLLGIMDSGNSVSIPGLRSSKASHNNSKSTHKNSKATSYSSVNDVWKYVTDWLTGLWKMFTRTNDPIGPLKSSSDVGSTRVSWDATPISLDQVKAIGSVYGVTVNDVMVSLISGALKRYTERASKNQALQPCRTLAPINLLPLPKRLSAEGRAKLGNHLAAMTFDLPVKIEGSVERLLKTKAITQSTKRSPELFVNSFLLGAAGYLSPKQREAAIRQTTDKVSLVMSNVPGPSEALTMSGIEVTDLKWIIPLFNNLGQSVQIISYNGSLRITMSHDQNLITAPELMPKFIRDEFNDLNSRTFPHQDQYV